MDKLADLDKIFNILVKNQDKPFVDRIFNTENYPVLDLGGGNYATHKMSWMSADEKHRVFPTVIPNGKGALIELSPQEAYDHALEAGDYIEFDNPDEADWFSKNYKRIWGD